MDARHTHSRAEGDWQHALELEKRLKATYRKKSFYDPEARTLRNQLRSQYESLLFLDAQFAATNDVEVLLWKSVFYRPIEEFRARIKQADKAGEAGAAQLPKVASAFLRFLEDASLFYRRLVMQLQAAYGDIGVKLDVPAAAAAAGARPGTGGSAGAAAVNGAMLYSTGSSVHRNISASIHRCLIYLGDLARYTAQAQPKADTAAASATAAPGKRPAVEREWQRARDYYRHAAKVLPRSGNPHNQLAVMAVMEGNALKAVYHYARSLCVGIPFLTARENLLLLFEQNRASYAELVSRKHQQQQQQLSIIQLHAEVGVSYVRLSGLLFDKINQHEYQAVCTSSAATLSTFLSHPAMLEFLQRQGRSDWQGRADTTPLHLIVLSIFAVQHSTSSGSERRGSASESAAGSGAAAAAGTFANAAQRSLQRSRALSMVFRTGRLLCQAGTAALSAAATAALENTNAAATAASSKPGVASLLLAMHILLQWLAAHPELAGLQVGHATEEEVKARAAFWAAAAQMLIAAAAACPAQEVGLRARGAAGAGTAGTRGVATAAGGGRAAGLVATGSGSAGAECEGGALPEEIELLGFEPLRSKHHWHVTDVGKHAVDEPATRASRMLAAARMVSASLSADQQQQQRFNAVATAASNAVQPQTLKHLNSGVQQFVAAVAAANTGQGSAGLAAQAWQPSAAGAVTEQQQQQQQGKQGAANGAAAISAPAAASGAAMDVDDLQQEQQQQQVEAADMATAAASSGQQQQQQQDDDDLEEEEVIVFKPRTTRVSASTSEEGFASASSTGAIAAATAAGEDSATAAAVASAAPPPLPQQLLASRSHGRQSGVSSPAAAAGSPQRRQQQQPADTAQPMVTSPVGSVKAAAVNSADLSKDKMDGIPGEAVPHCRTGGTSSPVLPGSGRTGPGVTLAGVGPGVTPVGSGTGSGGAAGMLLHGHAATALDLQQGQAASEMLLARLGGSSTRNTSPPVMPSAGGSAGFGGSGLSTSGLPPAPGYSSLGAGLQAAPGFSRGGSGLTAQVNPNVSGGGLRSQPPSPAMFAAAAAAGAGGFAGGSLMQQQQQQAMLGAGNSGFLGGLTAAGAAQASAPSGFGLHQFIPNTTDALNLNLGFQDVELRLSQPGGGSLDGFEGFDPLGAGLTSALSPGNAGAGFSDSLLGLFGNSAAAGAAGAGNGLQPVSNSVPSASLRIAQPQALQTGPELGNSAHVAYQLEQTAQAAANSILSPEHGSTGIALLHQQQQPQGLAGLMTGAGLGGGLLSATGAAGSGNGAAILQQQQHPGSSQRHLSTNPNSPSAVQATAAVRGVYQLHQQASLGRISAPSAPVQNGDVTLTSPAAAGGTAGGGGLAALGGRDGSASYAMFSGPSVFGAAAPGSSGLQAHNPGGRPGVLLPPVDFVQSQNPFAS